MKKDEKSCEKCQGHMRKYRGGQAGGGGAVYGLGAIGAAIYFISHVEGFWPVIVAFLKALVWPVFLVYNALNFLIK